MAKVPTETIDLISPLVGRTDTIILMMTMTANVGGGRIANERNIEMTTATEIEIVTAIAIERRIEIDDVITMTGMAHLDEIAEIEACPMRTDVRGSIEITTTTTARAARDVTRTIVTTSEVRPAETGISTSLRVGDERTMVIERELFA